MKHQTYFSQKIAEEINKDIYGKLEEVAVKLNISYTTVRSWLYGSVVNPKLDQLAKIGKLFGEEFVIDIIKHKIEDLSMDENN